MENASKALIIAGAIILAILIIGLGMSIFNQARDTVSQSNLDQEVVTQMNSKYESYQGTKVKGVNVKALIALVRDNNLAADNSTTYVIDITSNNNTGLALTTKSDATSLNNLRNKIAAGNTYTVTYSYSNGSSKAKDASGADVQIPSGLIYHIEIKKNS